MSNISDLIEKYLKQLLEASNQGQVEIQRNELAEKFNCVPSQINYVLTTRFSVEHGFVVESKRGGGGFVRIVKLPIDERIDAACYLCDLIGNNISQQGAEGITRRMLEQSFISPRESAVMKAALSRDVLRIALPARDQLRALILKAMIISILQFGEEEE
ncbi:MAG: CtsR family transcriptional regulator [Desulfocucumaceae bacterium]